MLRLPYRKKDESERVKKESDARESKNPLVG